MDCPTILRQAVDRRASDIFIVAGTPLTIKINGEMIQLDDQRLTPAMTEALIQEIFKLSQNRTMDRLHQTGEDDFSFSLSQMGRFRVNVYRQRGSLAAVLRVVRFVLPDANELHIGPEILAFSELKKGLVLITGAAGSGKSTTLAAMIDKINHTRAAHVLTLEDPVEYQYAPDRCIFNQREIGQDTVSFASALRAALREDPDIILVGEMRDRETIETAMTAAETGHLVLGTLHTNSAVDTIDRIVDAFPADRQQQIRVQLSMTLQAVLSQQLLPTTLGTSRTAACELLVVTAAVRNQIREGKTPQIAGTMAVSAQEGSVTMDASVLRLYQRGRISAQIAAQAARDKDFVKKHLPQSMGI